MQLVRPPARCQLAFPTPLTNVSMTSLRACVVTNQCRPSQRSMTLAPSAVTSPHKLLTSCTNSRWVGSAVWVAGAGGRCRLQNGTVRATGSSADGFSSAGTFGDREVSDARTRISGMYWKRCKQPAKWVYSMVYISVICQDHSDWLVTNNSGYVDASLKN